MSKRKNRSVKAGLLTSVIVIALVGVCVFSLYSLGNKGAEDPSVAAAGSGGTGTGKLLTRMDEAVADTVVAQVSVPDEYSVWQEMQADEASYQEFHEEYEQEPVQYDFSDVSPKERAEVPEVSDDPVTDESPAEQPDQEDEAAEPSEVKPSEIAVVLAEEISVEEIPLMAGAPQDRTALEKTVNTEIQLAGSRIEENTANEAAQFVELKDTQQAADSTPEQPEPARPDTSEQPQPFEAPFAQPHYSETPDEPEVSDTFEDQETYEAEGQEAVDAQDRDYSETDGQEVIEAEDQASAAAEEVFEEFQDFEVSDEPEVPEVQELYVEPEQDVILWEEAREAVAEIEFPEVPEVNEDASDYTEEEADEASEELVVYDNTIDVRNEEYEDDESYSEDEESYDNSSDDNDGYYESEYDEEDGYDDYSYDETENEWAYDYENDEWIYVGHHNHRRDDSGSYEDDYDENDEYDDYEESSYEESEEFNEESYEADDEQSDEGEWVYDYDLEDWVYVENTGHHDNNDDYDSDDDEDSPEDDYDDSDDEDSWEDDSDDYEEESYSLGQQIVDYAMGFVGVTPYVAGGRSLSGGTDCSGFVNLIYSAFGIYCSPASMAYDGSSFGYLISYDELQPGDIIVYGGGGHVAIYAGNGCVVHCSSPENGTVYWDMNYRSDMSWFLRVL